MNLPELKEDFYQRFESSSNFLHFTSCGVLCTLLGYIELENAPSLNCSLSMRTDILARKLNGNVISVENSRTNNCLCYHFNTPPKLYRKTDKVIVDLIKACEPYNISGGEVLCQVSIPEFLSKVESFSVAFIKSLLTVNDIDADILEIAAMCSPHSPINHSLALLSSKKGYCTLVDRGKPKNFPLPLSGYKMLSAHCTETDKTRAPHIDIAMKAIHKIYPHVLSIGDVTPEMFKSVKASIKDKTALNYMYHLVNENIRIKTATDALKRCDTKVLFREIKNSQKSMERYWNPGSEHLFLARSTENVDGIAAARMWSNGMMSIVENDKIDYAINMIKESFQTNIGYQPTFCVSEIF